MNMDLTVVELVDILRAPRKGNFGPRFAVPYCMMTNHLVRAGRGPSRLWAGLLGCFRVASLAGVATVLLSASPPPEGGEADTSDISATVTPPQPGRGEVLPAVAEPFRPGEYLKFSVQYGFIHAGSAYLEVPGVEQVAGHPVLLLQARAESNKFFSAFYKVRNRIQSYWDAEGRFSRRYAENRREGGYRTQSEIIFDYDRLEARYNDGRTFPVTPNVQDALSSFYYTRTQALPIGGSILFDYHASRRNVPLEVKILGRETVQTPAGKFDCVAVEPILKAGGIFKNKGRLVIWLTDDERRMPVLMKSKVTIGSISVVLQEYRPGA
jgi:hypothetical protein